jgi:hypothetical protein
LNSQLWGMPATPHWMRRIWAVGTKIIVGGCVDGECAFQVQ